MPAKQSEQPEIEEETPDSPPTTPLFQSPPLHLANEVVLQRFDGDVWSAIHRLATVVEMHHHALLDISVGGFIKGVKKATVSTAKTTYNLYKSATTEIHTTGIENEEDPEGKKYGDMQLPGFPKTLNQILAELDESNGKIKDFNAKLDKNQAENKAFVALITKRMNIDFEFYKKHCAEFNEYTDDLKQANQMHKEELALAKALLAKLQAIRKADVDKALKERKLQKAATKASAATATASELRTNEEEEKRKAANTEYQQKRKEEEDAKTKEQEEKRTKIKAEAQRAAADIAAAPGHAEVKSATKPPARPQSGGAKKKK